MGTVRQVHKAEWRSFVVTRADIETPKGLVQVRFIYIRSSDELVHITPKRTSFHALGLSRGQVHALLIQAKNACLWKIKETEMVREERERRAQEHAQEETKHTHGHAPQTIQLQIF